MAYINSKDVAQIRKELKAAYPNLTFSVRKEHSTSVHVSIVAGDIDFTGVLGGRGHISVNHYHTCQYNDHAALFDGIIDIMKTAPSRTPTGGANAGGWFDKSDIQSDYFHTAYYLNLDIGKWDKAYNATDAELITAEIEIAKRNMAEWEAKLAKLESARDMAAGGQFPITESI